MKTSITFGEETKKLMAALSKDGVARQARFATVKTLTQVAFDARAKVQSMLRKDLKIKRPFLPGSVVVERATMKTNTPFAVIGFLKRATLVDLLEKGGNRRPHKSRNIVIPINARTSRGTIPRGKRPAALLARGGFIATINGAKGIWMKTTGRQAGLKLMYYLTPDADYRPRTIRFYETVNRTVPAAFRNRFQHNFAEAIRTAKR